MATVTNRRSLMTLFSGPDCPKSHRVRLVLAEKGITSLDIVELEAVSDLAPQPPALVGLLLGNTLHILWNTRHRGHVQEHLGLPRTPFSSHLSVPFTINLKTCSTVKNLMSEIS